MLSILRGLITVVGRVLLCADFLLQRRRADDSAFQRRCHDDAAARHAGRQTVAGGWHCVFDRRQLVGRRRIQGAGGGVVAAGVFGSGVVLLSQFLGRGRGAAPIAAGAVHEESGDRRGAADDYRQRTGTDELRLRGRQQLRRRTSRQRRRCSARFSRGRRLPASRRTARR